MATPLQWAVKTFGPIARNRDERALRLLEEAIEFAQAEGVPMDVAQRQLLHTYSKPPGDPVKELSGVALTLDACAENLGYHASALLRQEFKRVQEKPQSYWDTRHATKAAEGRANLSPVEAT